MSRPLIRTALAAGVAASLTVVPTALARPVFGGATGDGEAIVVRSDAKHKKLASAVVAWDATCKSGPVWSDWAEVTPAAIEPGFTPDPGDLAMIRNGKGRFSGVEAYTSGAGDGLTGLVTVELAGRIKGDTTSGTLHANVAIVDNGGRTQDACDSGTVRWSAKRAPGRIFGGKTSQSAPVVVRLDRARRKVSDLLIGWGSEHCVPDAFLSYPEHFGGFPIRARRFGAAFTQDFASDDGSKRTFSYDVKGTTSRSAASGSFHVKVDEVDGSGANTLSCDSGAIGWRALTG